MSFIRSVNILSHREFTPAAKRLPITIAIMSGLAVLVFGSRPTVADEPEAVSQTASAESSEMSARQKRRAERRREHEESDSAVESATANAADEATATDGPAPLVFVVAVEPEMECRRVAVVGSRMPKEVCTPVGLRDEQEEQAQEFLRRTRERSTIVVPCPVQSPSLPGPAATFC